MNTPQSLHHHCYLISTYVSCGGCTVGRVVRLCVLPDVFKPPPRFDALEKMPFRELGPRLCGVGKIRRAARCGRRVGSVCAVRASLFPPLYIHRHCHCCRWSQDLPSLRLRIQIRVEFPLGMHESNNSGPTSVFISSSLPYPFLPDAVERWKRRTGNGDDSQELFYECVF